MANAPTISEVVDKVKSDVSNVLYNMLNTGLDALTLPAKITDDMIRTFMGGAPVPHPFAMPGLPMPQLVTKPFPTPIGYVQLPVIEFTQVEQPRAPQKTQSVQTAQKTPVTKEVTPAGETTKKEEEFVFAIGR